MISQRLRRLRLASGLSLEALATKIGGVVTKQALSKYEHGKARPSLVILNKLAKALGVKSADLWSEPTVDIQFIAYRKGSGLSKKEQARVESLVGHALEERIRLQRLTHHAGVLELPVQALLVQTLDDVEEAAERLRARWNLGLDPIASVVDALEDQFVHVLDIDADEKFDGISAVASDEGQVVAAAVVSRRGLPGERQRLNLAHELGHLVLTISQGVDEEQAAFRFGAAFLVPAPTLRREVGARRAYVQPEELLLLKRRFGLSVQALLYRLRDLGIIGESHYKRWRLDIGRYGWKQREPLELPPERPRWLRQNVLRCLAEGLLTREDAERLLGETVEMAQPLSLIERQTFMGLPLAERRRILAEQAERLAAHYEQDQEWKELQAGDIVEY